MNKPVSNCCGAPVRVDGDVTNYHVCEKCKQACDVGRDAIDHDQICREVVKRFGVNPLGHVLPLIALFASAICSFAQRGTGSNPIAIEPTPVVSIFALPQAAVVSPFKQTYLTWDNPLGASNRVSWGTVRNYWTNGSRTITTNTFPVTNGWAYKVTAMVNGIESAPALWPSNRIGELWLTGMGTNFSGGTNIVQLAKFTNSPPGNMQLWGVANVTTGWE